MPRALPAGPRLLDYLVACLIPVYVWRIQDALPLLAKIQFPIIISLLTLAVFVLEGQAAVTMRLLKTPVLKVALFILFWCAVSVPASVYPGLSFGFVVNDFSKTFLMMLMIASSIRNVNDVERLGLANIIGAVIYCAKILTTFRMGSDGRLDSELYYDANDICMMVVCTLPLTVYFLRGGSKVWQKLLALPAAGLFMLTIARTGSRGGFLGLLAVLGFLLVGFRAIPAKMRVGSVAGLAVALILVAGPQYWTMMNSILHPEEDYNTQTESGRTEIWKRGIGYMARRPLTGVGVNAFTVAEGTLSELAARQAEGQGLKWSAAHNSYVQIGAELGIPGLIAFVVFLFQLLKSGWRTSRSPRREGRDTARQRAMAEALVATMVGYCVCGFFLSQAYAAYLYLTCGMICGLSVVSMGRSGVRRPSAPMTQGHRGQQVRIKHA